MESKQPEPPGPSLGDPTVTRGCLSPCSVREAWTCRTREQSSWGAHFMAVDSVRASRTDGDRDLGACRQKLLKMFPGEKRRGVSARGSPGPGEALWVAQPVARLRDSLSGEGAHCLAPVQPENWPLVNSGPTPEPAVYWAPGEARVGRRLHLNVGAAAPSGRHRCSGAHLLLSWPPPCLC